MVLIKNAMNWYSQKFHWKCHKDRILIFLLENSDLPDAIKLYFVSYNLREKTRMSVMGEFSITVT
jgi:hypothetical protein